MEELQDAIEDAQYINAMNDDSPRPTKQWTMPSEEELQSYIERTKACNPDEMTVQHICSTPLGFYLVFLPVKTPLPVPYSDLFLMCSFCGLFERVGIEMSAIS